MYVVYEVEHVADAVASLPPKAITAYLELRAALEVAPWGFPSVSGGNPDGAFRRAMAGPDDQLWVHYVIVEHEHVREVIVVEIIWLG